MIGRSAEPHGRAPFGPEVLGGGAFWRRSSVGLAGSLGLHALFFAVVWSATGLPFSDDVRDEPVRIVRLVPGDRDTPVTPPSQIRPAGKPSGARPAARPAPPRPMARPAEPPAVAAPAPSAAPEPVAPAPVPAPAVAAVAPAPAEPASPEPVIGEPAPAASTPQSVAQSPADPAVESPVPPSAVAKEAAGLAEAPVEPGLDTARATVEGPVSPLQLPALQDVMSAATVAARAHGEPFIGRRDVFEFLLDNLEFASHVTRALRVARYRVWRTAEGLVLDDGWGSILTLSVVEASSGARVLYARGHYRQRLLPDIHGQAVLMIHYDTTPADGGRDRVSASVTSYVKVENSFMALLLKMANATATDKAELESRRLVRTFARVSRAIEDDPVKVFDQVRRSPDVPQAPLEQFRRLLGIP